MAKITCCSLSQLKTLKSNNAVNLFIVRNQKNSIANVTHFQYLAPSRELYSFAMSNKERPGWWDVYKKMFLLELESKEKAVGLGIVKDFVNSGFDVNLICYCGDASKCHRSLVGTALQEMGLEVDII